MRREGDRGGSGGGRSPVWERSSEWIVHDERGGRRGAGAPRRDGAPPTGPRTCRAGRRRGAGCRSSGGRAARGAAAGTPVDGRVECESVPGVQDRGARRARGRRGHGAGRTSLDVPMTMPPTSTAGNSVAISSQVRRCWASKFWRSTRTERPLRRAARTACSHARRSPRSSWLTRTQPCEKSRSGLRALIGPRGREGDGRGRVAPRRTRGWICPSRRRLRGRRGAAWRVVARYRP